MPLIHEFRNKRGRLYCEGVPLSRIAQAAGTPVYVYSYKVLTDHYDKLVRAFRRVQPLICFSVKANANLAILKILVWRGAGLDIVSGGELYKALRVGCPPERIVFASVGKSPDEIQQALAAGIFCFNVESVAELEAINAAARRLGRRARVALRLNPNVDAHTHHYITTGVATSKFGIHMDVAEDVLLRRRSRFSAVEFLGFHLHIGSQITQSAPFVEAIRKVGAVIGRLRSRGVPIEWLNLGGGLGIIYKDERPQTAEQFAKAVLPLIERLNIRLILEPGRFIIGNAGALVTRVIYEKTPGSAAGAAKKKFLVVDAGMNDLIRPALYGAHHDIVPVAAPGRAAAQAYDVVGPVCESADVFARDRRLPKLAAGDLLALLGAGAYGFVMASNYNGRARPAEVLVKGSKWFIVRKRESMADLVRHEVMPRELVSNGRSLTE